MKETVIAGIVFFVVVFAGVSVSNLVFPHTVAVSDGGSFGNVRLCTVTENLVALGHQEATTILGSAPRQWAIIQQPINATNTASLSFGGTAVSGRGIQLSTSTPTPDSQIFGLATEKPYQGAISAITDTGSTTVKVIQCR